LAVGLRPINNIVDISNYVMLELGIPLHIFDRKKIIGGQVHIRSLEENQKFTTLDEVERELVVGDTIIEDKEKTLVLAGIMGGLNSGVDETTTEIFIEVANWKASEVRKTSTRLGLRTDSSMRYEKTLDSQLCYRTLLRTFEMVLKQCPNALAVGGVEYDGDDLNSFKPLEISIAPEEISRTLGKEISVSQITQILESLDFKVDKSDENLRLTVPSYRSTKDIECRADIIEEIGRIIGYDNINPQGPLLGVSPVRLSPLQILKRKSQDFLVEHGHALELTTYPMVGDSLLKKCSWPHDFSDLKLVNSLSVDHDRMRGSMVPSFLEVAALNSKNKDHFRFFEWGRTYKKSGDFAEESTVLAIAYFSKTASPCLDLLNDVEALCRFTNIPADIVDAHPKFKNEVVSEDWVGIHPYEFKNLRIMGKMKGAVLSVHPLILKKMKIKGHLSLGLIDMSAFESRLPKEKFSYKALPKFPSSRFDYTLELRSDQSVIEIFDALKKVKVKADISHKIVDIFTPDNGEKYVTMAALLSNPEKTLEGEFIKECEEKIINSLEQQGILLKKG
jgi:phenylalanyl-tRNA synthetase beta chain